MNYGEALRDHRRAAGWTQEELAARAGVSPRTISAFESGQGATPRRDTMALLAQALGLEGTDRDAFEATVIRRPRQRRNSPPDAMPRSPDRPRHNLPRPLTSFVGREQELRELGRVLETAPLVTLVGAGGIGKTRLAQELARSRAEKYADGAWLVELAELGDPALAVSAVGVAVGLQRADARLTTQILTDYLRPRHTLLVLDNCEHLVGACAELVGHLLRMCPNLHVLATSREPLAIEGEVRWLVRPLDVPDPWWHDSTDEIGSAAVRLFVERARAVTKGFGLTDENATAIVRVCSAVDGIPLGLELAAARTRILGLSQLAERLERDGQILSGPRRDETPRHRTIRATIDWSHDLLGERERIFLRRLSVFASGWTLAMAEDVCSGAGIERADVLELLTQLVDRSMVLMTACDAAARYRLLEPIRRYASERLNAAGETAAFGARHAAVALRTASAPLRPALR